MSYKKGSFWNDKVELACLIILKKLQHEKERLQSINFPHGLQTKLVDELINNSNFPLPPRGSLMAKVGNFKSVAKVNRHSKASSNTERIYDKFNGYSLTKLEKEYHKMP